MKISRSVYLLVVLIEECAEVIQRACKAIRFGLDDKQAPKDGQTFENNRERLHQELRDLRTAIYLLERDKNIPDVYISVEKIHKVEKYHKLSMDLGIAEGPALYQPNYHVGWDRAEPGTDETVQTNPEPNTIPPQLDGAEQR